jgi:predicted anti-sigma-YlaC factor YlaD
MECKKIQNILPAYVDNNCGAEDTAVIEGHLATCDMCRKFLSNLLDKPSAGKPVRSVEDNKLTASEGKSILVPKNKNIDESLTTLEYIALAVAIIVLAIIVYIFIKK